LGAVIAGLLAAGILFLLLQLQAMKRNQCLLSEEKKVLEARIKSLESKIDFLNTGSMGIGQRLMSTEKRLNKALERQDEMVQNNSDQLFRRQADRVLQGRNPSEIDEGAPSRSEAKLMALVSKQQSKNS
jgi:hypothetical protein